MPIIAQQPQTYIGPKERTLRKNILEKVAMFGILLGSGLLLAPFFTALSAIPLIAGAAITAFSAYAFHYLSNIDSSHALANAAEAGNCCMLNFLLLLGANPNVDSGSLSALGRAATYGHSDIIRHLLNAGANPNNTDGYYQTPLYQAVINNQDDAAEILLEYGADPKIQTRAINPAGNPIEWAIRQQALFFHHPDFDHSILGDKRTRAERVAAADRIVDILRPYMEEEPLPPNE